MTNGKMISVRVPFREEDETGVWSGDNTYWAVKPPRDNDSFQRAGEDEVIEAPLFRTGWWIQGSQDVEVRDKDDIRGYRELLDYIEREMGDE